VHSWVLLEPCWNSQSPYVHGLLPLGSGVTWVTEDVNKCLTFIIKFELILLQLEQILLELDPDRVEGFNLMGYFSNFAVYESLGKLRNVT
jgi:hypothetical protein